MRWADAHGAAMIASVQAQSDFLGAPGTYVDVFEALCNARVEMMGKSLGRLFGAYFGPEQDGPAVLLNVDFNETTMRHTAAHELGHHFFQHGTTADEHLDPPENWGRRSWPPHEMLAEAFAAWFLMPQHTIRKAFEALGITHVTTAEQAYQLSLWLGTSFRGTVRHLLHLRKISARQADAWLHASPAILRRPLDRGAASQRSPRHWDLGPSAADRELHTQAGDRLTIRLAGRWHGHLDALPPGIEVIDYVDDASGQASFSSDQPLVAVHRLRLTVGPAMVAPTTLAVGGGWEITLNPIPDRHGHSESWAPTGGAIHRPFPISHATRKN